MRTFCIFIFLLIFFSIGLTLAEDSNDLKSLNDSTIIYFNNGNYQDALKCSQRVVIITKDLYGAEDINYAKSLINFAKINESIGRYNVAETAYFQSAEIIKKILGVRSPDYAIIINELASIYTLMGRYSEAEPLYLLAEKLLGETLGCDNMSYSIIISGLATLYTYLGEYAKAENLYNESITIRKSISGDSTIYFAISLNNLATLYELLGRYEETTQLLIQSLEILKRKLGVNNPDYAKVLNNLATVYISMKKFTEADSMLINAKDLIRNFLGENHPIYASVLNNQANLFKSIGKYNEALELYQKALNIRKNQLGEEHPSSATSLSNIAIFELKNFNTGAKEINVTKKKSKINRKPDDFSDINDPKSANRSIGPDLKNKYKNQPRSSVKEIGDISISEYRERNEIPEYRINQKADMLSMKYSDDYLDYSSNLSNMANLYVRMNRKSDAESLLNEALEIRKTQLGEEHPDYASSLFNLALLYLTTERYSEAESLFSKVLDIDIKRLNNIFPAFSEREKGEFLNTFLYHFEIFNSFIIKRMKDNPELIGKMYDNQLITKSILLSSSRKVRDRILSSNDSILQSLYNGWKYKKEYIAKQIVLSKKQLKERNINLDSLQYDANEIEKELSLKSTIFAKEYDKKKYSWKNIRDELKSTEAAIEIVRFRFYDNSYTDSVFYAALIITQKTLEHPDLILLNNGIDLENKFYKLYRKYFNFDSLQSYYTEITSDSLNDVKDINNFFKNKIVKTDFRSLYKQFWEKIQKNIPGISRVYLSQDGVYNTINLSTLLFSDVTTLFDALEIHLVTSTRELIEKKDIGRKQNQKKVAALFGNPDFNLNIESYNQINIKAKQSNNIKTSLKSYFKGDDNWSLLKVTEFEVKKIDTILKSKHWQTSLYIGENALEENIKLLESPDLLHISTHGFFKEDLDVKEDDILGPGKSRIFNNPLLRSGLVLAGANKFGFKDKQKTDNVILRNDDGILTAYEAMNLNLDSTLIVVLSACETGLGDIKNGEGVYGLQRAFQVAGARQIIMSLWEVEETSNQKLMVYFYNNWMNENNKGDVYKSFRDAQIQLRKEYPSPFFWGAFVLIGL